MKYLKNLTLGNYISIICICISSCIIIFDVYCIYDTYKERQEFERLEVKNLNFTKEPYLHNFMESYGEIITTDTINKRY